MSGGLDTTENGEHNFESAFRCNCTVSLGAFPRIEYTPVECIAPKMDKLPRLSVRRKFAFFWRISEEMRD